MTATEPEVADNGRYTVTEAAKVLEISRQTIKRHVMACLLNPTIHKRTKRKTFSGKEIKRYWKNIY